MKLIVCILIILIFGLIGYLYKKRLNEQYLILKFISNFHNYYMTNINLFKNDIVQIINNYKITQINKNAKYIQIFENNSNIIQINEKILNLYIYDKDVFAIVKEYFANIGKTEYSIECEKNTGFDKYLNLKIQESLNNVQTKGVLYFKLLLAIGSIIAIIIW